MAVKSLSDVTINLSITALPNSGTAKIAVLTSGTDSNAHSYTFSSIAGVENTFDENSNVYSLVQKAFETDGYNGQVEVIVAPSSDVSTGSSTTTTSTSVTTGSSATSASTSSSSSTVNRFVYALKQYVNDGFNYVVDDNLKESDLEAVTDYLYSKQAAAVITQVNSVSALQTLSAYSSKNQPKTGDKLNGVYAIVETSSRKPAVQVAARLAQYNFDIGGVDAKKVGELSEFQADDDLTAEDLKAIDAARGSAVANLADMQMMYRGYSLGENFLDEYINTKIVKDTFQYNLQRALNDIKTRAYNQDTINFLYTVAVNTGNDLFTRNFLAEAPTIDKLDFAQVANQDITSRDYRGFNVHATISNSVETMAVRINLAE